MDSSTVIKYQMKIFKIFGLRTSGPSNRLLFIRSFIVFILAGLGLVLSQGTSMLFASSFNDFIEQLLLFCTTSTVAMKIIVLYTNQKSLTNVLVMLREVDGHLKTHQDFDMMNVVHKICSWITIFYTCIYCVTISSIFCQVPFLARDKLTWKSTSLLPYPFAKGPIVYYGVLFCQALGNTMNCAISWAIDTYGLLLTLLLSKHFEVLGSHFENLGSNSGQVRLIHCLKYYEQINEFAYRLKRHLSMILFIQVGISAPVICICTYQFAQAQQLTNIQLLFLSGYTCGMLLQIFSPNFAGSLAMETSALLPQSAFLSKWFEWSQSDKKAMSLFVLRTMRPFRLMGGIFFELNLNTFIRIMKTAYSFFAVLQSTQM